MCCHVLDRIQFAKHVCPVLKKQRTSSSWLSICRCHLCHRRRTLWHRRSDLGDLGGFGQNRRRPSPAKRGGIYQVASWCVSLLLQRVFHCAAIPSIWSSSLSAARCSRSIVSGSGDQ